MVDVHHHTNSHTLGSGRLELPNKEIEFINASIFLHTEDLEEQQRVCMTFSSDLSEGEVKSFDKPFGKLVLDSPFFVGNFPIKRLSVFLLSATIKQQTVDLLISPKNRKLESLFRGIY